MAFLVMAILSRKFQRFRTRGFLWLNRKPNTPKMAFFSLVMPWVMVAVLGTVLIIIVGMIVDSGNYSVLTEPLTLGLIIGIAVWAIIVICGWIYIGVSSMRIYLDVIYKRYLDYREEQITKATAELKKEG